MASKEGDFTLVLTTAFASIITGFVFGIYTTRGYLISPSLTAERRANLRDAVESDESDVDEGDSLLDHAPNWANGVDADRKQGLTTKVAVGNSKEECKLVLVVRTDLGMTKGTHPNISRCPSSFALSTNLNT